MKLENNRIILKSLCDKHKDDIIAVLSNGVLTKYEYYDNDDNYDMIAQRIIHSGSYLGIWRKSDYRFVGYISFNQVTNGKKNEIGIMLREEMQGLGYAKDAVLLFWDYYKKKYKDYLYALCVEDNTKGICSLERNGFQKVEIIPNAFYKNQKKYNVIRFVKKE